MPIDILPREMDALRLISRGFTMKETAARMHVRKTTVSSYTKSLRSKLGVTTTVEMVAVAYRLRLVVPDDGPNPTITVPPEIKDVHVEQLGEQIYAALSKGRSTWLDANTNTRWRYRRAAKAALQLAADLRGGR